MVNHTAKEVIKLLKDEGYYDDHTAGDHHIFIDGCGGMIPVPYVRLKDSIHINTYKLVLKELREQKERKNKKQSKS